MARKWILYVKTTHAKHHQYHKLFKCVFSSLHPYPLLNSPKNPSLSLNYCPQLAVSFPGQWGYPLNHPFKWDCPFQTTQLLGYPHFIIKLINHHSTSISWRYIPMILGGISSTYCPWCCKIPYLEDPIKSSCLLSSIFARGHVSAWRPPTHRRLRCCAPADRGPDHWDAPGAQRRVEVGS